MNGNVKSVDYRKVGSTEVFVVDGLFSESILKRLHLQLQVAGYSLCSATSNASTEWNETMTELDVEDFVSDEFGRILVSEVNALNIDRRHLNASKVLVNSIRSGDVSFVHKDSDKDSEYSVLVYVNPLWEEDWAGETIFYDTQSEPVTAVSFRPGRVVIFPSKVLHRAGIQMSTCQDFRYTLSIRMHACNG